MQLAVLRLHAGFVEDDVRRGIGADAGNAGIQPDLGVLATGKYERHGHG
jgi:hypothetical protein